jgi:hypothetical protein
MCLGGGEIERERERRDRERRERGGEERGCGMRDEVRN